MARGFSLRRVFPAWWLRPEQTKALLGGSPSRDFAPGAPLQPPSPVGLGVRIWAPTPPGLYPPRFLFSLHISPTPHVP